MGMGLGSANRHVFSLDNQLRQIRPRLWWVDKNQKERPRVGPRNGNMGWVEGRTWAVADCRGGVWSSDQAQNEGS